jgi:hypothetical protein
MPFGSHFDLVPFPFVHAGGKTCSWCRAEKFTGPSLSSWPTHPLSSEARSSHHKEKGGRRGQFQAQANEGRRLLFSVRSCLTLGGSKAAWFHNLHLVKCIQLLSPISIKKPTLFYEDIDFQMTSKESGHMICRGRWVDRACAIKPTNDCSFQLSSGIHGNSKEWL